MTTIQLTATPLGTSPSVVPATRLRLTTRGRRVVAGLAAFPAIVALTIAIVSGGSALASADADTAAASVEFTTVTVQPGDTLWSIAEAVAPASDPRDVVDAIVRLNALGTAELFAGESLAIPLEYVAAP